LALVTIISRRMQYSSAWFRVKFQCYFLFWGGGGE